MALPINDAAMLVALAREMESKIQVVCLGVPDLGFTMHDLLEFCHKIGIQAVFPKGVGAGTKLTARSFFSWLGFKSCISMDYSDYEGAEIIHNLNEPYLNKQYHGIADLVFDGGTLEHVFHIPNALNTVHSLLRSGGMVYHVNPSNGYLDHGFYQICPTLYYDYYRENSYDIVSANLINRYRGEISSEPYLTDIYRNKGMFYAIKELERCTVAFVARKTSQSTMGVIPTQSFYRQMHSDFQQGYENERPFTYRVSSLMDKIRFRFPFLVKWKRFLKRKN